MDAKRLKQIGPVPPGGGAYAEKLREKRFVITEQRVEKAIEKFPKKCKKSGISNQIKRETGDPF
jgi:hypothetical protein